ncbi:MAG: hypothetical protein ABEH35_07380 [Haloarculaceae archaeon]
MAVRLDGDVLFQYRRFTLYNSPYAAHDHGHAVDLYPAPGEPVPSPVAGEVLETKRVRAPDRPYAADHDSLVLVDTDECVARLLHVDPTVAAGDRVAVGEPLGDPIRAGFFAPWVPNHVHLGFRTPEQDPYRASGSLPIEIGVEVRPLDWDGTGTVVETGETWARLDSPAHPDPGETFVGLAAGDPRAGDRTERPVLDGGFPHYDGGGLIGGTTSSPAVCGTPVGTVSGEQAEGSGTAVSWADVTVRANGDPVTGLALFCARDRFGVKLVGRDLDFEVGETVAVTVERDG